MHLVLLGGFIAWGYRRMRSLAETHASVWEIWRMMVSSTEIRIIKGRRDLGETGERATPGSATEHFLDLRRLHKRMCVKPFGEVLHPLRDVAGTP